MPRRVLFIAALHHPQQLQRDIAATPADQPAPLFPHSMGQHGWERAFRAAGYSLDVFWRNLPGYGSRDIARLQQDRFGSGWTPGRVMQALGQRIPPRFQPGIQRRNQLLLRQAARFQPDIIWLSGDNREITPETLARLKRQHDCKLIYVTGVSPIVFSKANEQAAARLYDLYWSMTITMASLAGVGRAAHGMPALCRRRPRFACPAARRRVRLRCRFCGYADAASSVQRARGGAGKPARL